MESHRTFGPVWAKFLQGRSRRHVPLRKLRTGPGGFDGDHVRESAVQPLLNFERVPREVEVQVLDP